MSAEKYEESFISWQNIAHYRRFENSTWLHVWIAAWQGLAKNISRWGVVLALTLVFATISPAFAADYRYSISNDEATITKYNGTGGDVVIPSSLNEYPVTSIGYEAFLYCSSLTSVVIPDSVTSIGEWAFYVCSGLTSMVIPDGVTSIGFCAFSYCSSLTSVVIADSVTSTSIGVRAFYGCSNLTSVVIPDSVTSIGDYAFQNCSGLTSVVIPDSVTSIGNHAFYGCSGLTSVVIPDSVTSIGNHAFYGCSGLTSVVFGNGVTSIGDYAFRVCSSLKSVVIPDSVTSIGNYAFSSSSNLTSMVIPDSVTSIGDYAFYSCYGLTSVVIGNSVTNIGSSAFYSCSSLTSVVIGNSVTSIGSSAFSGCTGLTSMVIPDSVTSIGNRAFYGCKGLTSVVIPDSVTSIGDYAFQNCSGLTSVVIPDSVTFLGRNMFYRCTSLSSVVFLGNVTYVGVEAFAQCKNLAGVYFAGLPPTLGGSDVFTNCPSVIYYISGTPGWGEEYGGRPTAIWANNATFDGNGGTPTVSEQTYNAGVTYPDLPTANRPGFSFSGWWTEADGGTQITEDILVPLLTVGCMLYAQWEVSPGFFSVKFELGVHGMRTGGDEQHQAIKDGMAAEPPGVTPRQGWGFFGWDRDFSHVTAPMTVRAVYSYPYTLASGWNLISINLILSDDSCVKLQNNGAIILDSNSKAYVHSGNLASYHSCWIHCQDAKTITVVGTSPDNFELPVTLKKDWNFVGPIIDSFLSGDNAIAWEWNGQYFSPTENLRSGSGYYLYLPNNHAEVIPIIGDYFIIDLSAGPEAASYPMSFLAEIPAGGWTDEYKTTKLVLRKISAGTFTMGSPEDELGRESGSTQHQVTLTKDFYVG
ncbi:MAG: leucine-rich repeat protein, partial [Atribacterota bacterium]|nr:leucine-rich repeat protein [Atribacterota bacterium]